MKLKPEKNSGLNGIPTRELCDTGAVLYQLSYQTNRELGSDFINYPKTRQEENTTQEENLKQERRMDGW